MHHRINATRQNQSSSKIRSFLWLSLGLAFLAFLLTRCAVETPEKWKSEPFTFLSVKPNEFHIDNAKGDTVETKYGTSIIVPPHCFVDENGDQIEGEVVLSFQEIHKPGEVLASGISMRHSEDGRSGNLVTAGMFELKGSHKGKTVQFAKQKALDISMPSMLNREDVSFYKMDTTTGSWETKEIQVTTDEIKEDQAKSDAASDIDKPIPPREPKGGNVIDLSFDDERLDGFKGSFWHYAGDDPKLDPYNYEEFQQGSYVVSDYEVIMKNEVKVRVDFLFRNTTTSEETKLTTQLSPVLTGTALEKALATYEENLNLYNQRIATAAQARQLAKKAFIISRQFQLNSFGVFNWDCFSAVADAKDKVYTLNYKGKQVRNANVFLVRNFDGRKSIVRQRAYAAGVGSLTFSPSEETQLVVIFPDEKIGIVNSSEMKLFSFNTDRHSPLAIEESYEVSTLEDIDSIISQL